MGACATIVVHALIPWYERTGRWEAVAWWIHDHLPYDELEFFPKYAAFNYCHGDRQRRRIRSYIPPAARLADQTRHGERHWRSLRQNMQSGSRAWRRNDHAPLHPHDLAPCPRQRCRLR